MDSLKEKLKRVKNVAESFANLEGDQQELIELILAILVLQNEDKDNILLNFLKRATPEQKNEVLEFLEELKEKQTVENNQDDNSVSITINVKI